MTERKPLSDKVKTIATAPHAALKIRKYKKSQEQVWEESRRRGWHQRRATAPLVTRLSERTPLSDKLKPFVTAPHAA